MNQSALIGLMFVAVTAAAAVSGAPRPLTNLPMACSYTFQDGTHYDFSSLATATGTFRQDTSDEDRGYNINVCNVAQGDGPNGVCAQSDTTLCMVLTYETSWFPLAEINATSLAQPSWSLLDPSNPGAGVQWLYSNGIYGPTPPTVYYNFICNQTASETTYRIKKEYAYEIYNVNITSALACPQSKLVPPAPSIFESISEQ